MTDANKMYDEVEAKQLLAELMERVVPDRPGREAAAKGLLKQLQDLCVQLKIRTDSNDDGISLQFRHNLFVFVSLNPNRPFTLHGSNSVEMSLELHYDPLGKVFQGPIIDDKAHPPLRQSALATVVQKAIETLTSTRR